jgi:hypothetical protein
MPTRTAAPGSSLRKSAGVQGGTSPPRLRSGDPWRAKENPGRSLEGGAVQFWVAAFGFKDRTFAEDVGGLRGGLRRRLAFFFSLGSV